MDASFSDATEIQASSCSSRMRQVRIAVLVAIGISVGLAGGFSWNSMKSSPQPPVDLINIENKMERGDSNWKDFHDICEHKWHNRPKPGGDNGYRFISRRVPSQGGWSYEKQSCDERAIKSCEEDKNCAGLAGHQNPYGRGGGTAYPECWKMRVSARAVKYKSDWWVCLKDDHRRHAR